MTDSATSGQLWPQNLIEQAAGIIMNRFDLDAAHALQVLRILKLWTFSPTIAPIAGIRWATYDAVTEYLDYVVPVRRARTASDPSAARVLRNITTGSSQSLTAQAFPTLQTL